MKWLLILLVLVAACSECEEYSNEECPGSCRLCPDSPISSYASCHSREYCEQEIECLLHTADTCPEECSVCPPCEECSSITCQPEKYCEKLGFSPDWYESVKPK